MVSRLSPFTDRLVALAKRAVSGDPGPAVKKGYDGYSDLTLFEDALTHGSIALCRGGPNLHVWRYPQPIDGGDGTLWDCEHCPVRLLAKKWGERFIMFGDCPNPSWPLMELEANPWRCGHRCHTEYAGYDRDVCPDCRAPVPIDDPS